MIGGSNCDVVAVVNRRYHELFVTQPLEKRCLPSTRATGQLKKSLAFNHDRVTLSSKNVHDQCAVQTCGSKLASCVPFSKDVDARVAFQILSLVQPQQDTAVCPPVNAEVSGDEREQQEISRGVQAVDAPDDVVRWLVRFWRDVRANRRVEGAKVFETTVRRSRDHSVIPRRETQKVRMNLESFLEKLNSCDSLVEWIDQNLQNDELQIVL